MSLATTIANAVSVANRVTSGLQCSVLCEFWVGQSLSGAPKIERQTILALVEKRQQRLRTLTGEEQTSRHYIVFLQPLSIPVAAGRANPIDPRDKFVLPDGATGPVLSTTGFVNPDTSQPYLSEIWLG